VIIPAAMHRELRHLSLATRRTITYHVTKAIQAYLASHPKALFLSAPAVPGAKDKAKPDAGRKRKA